MIDFLFLVPIALGLGLVGLGAFFWALGDGQYDDLDGAAERILFEDDDRPERVHQPPRPEAIYSARSHLKQTVPAGQIQRERQERGLKT
jgi:cbb3-type cytochrome oxidase maturation protein